MCVFSSYVVYIRHLPRTQMCHGNSVLPSAIFIVACGYELICDCICIMMRKTHIWWLCGLGKATKYLCRFGIQTTNCKFLCTFFLRYVCGVRGGRLDGYNVDCIEENGIPMYVYLAVNELIIYHSITHLIRELLLDAEWTSIFGSPVLDSIVNTGAARKGCICDKHATAIH